MDVFQLTTQRFCYQSLHGSGSRSNALQNIGGNRGCGRSFGETKKL